MARLIQKCIYCGKIIQEKSRIDFPNERMIEYECGHIITIPRSELKDAGDIKSISGKQLYHFQCDNVNAIADNDGRFGIFDEMGLGKTPSAICFLLTYPEYLPALILVKAGLKLQWTREIIDWSNGKIIPQIINKPNEPILGMPITIISLDLVKNMMKQILLTNFNTVVIDECQAIKNPTSKRAIAVKEICKDKKAIIPLSGTPFKNNGSEFFTILNIIAPTKFPSYSHFIYRWVDSYIGSGGFRKLGGIIPRRIPEFKEYCKDIFLRHERKDVMPDLPVITRNLRVIDMEDEELKKAYNKKTKEFSDLYDDYEAGGSKDQTEYSNLLAMMARLRHLTGIAKVDPTIEFVEEFLLTTDRKIVIFTHHKDVANMMTTKLLSICSDGGYPVPLQITSEDSMEDRDYRISEFQNNGHRILIAPTLACGEGLNMQFCADCIIMEREWNPMNEEQAEGRFIRIGQKSDVVISTYPTAANTIDEMLAQLVERKRAQFTSVMSDKITSWDQSSIIKELMSEVARKGRSGLWQL